MKQKIDYRKSIIVIIFILGVLLRLEYITSDNIYFYQHDVFGKDEHINYILNIYDGKGLPNTNAKQYYHTPLHHILSAIWLKFISTIGIKIDTDIVRTLSVLTFIYSVLLMYYFYKIAKLLDLKFIYKVLIISVAAFWPRYIIFSGSINNDLLSYLLITMCLYMLIKWYRNTNYKNTIKLALLAGLCVMAKMSGSIVAIPIIYVFIIKLIDYLRKKELKSYIKYIILFGFISLPIALWYPIRNYVLFKQPLFYITHPRDIVNKSYFEKIKLNSNIFTTFFLIDFRELIEIICYNWMDKNILSYVIKGSFFGEFTFYIPDKVMGYEIIAIFFNLILFIVSLFIICKELIKCINKKECVEINIFTIFIVINIISFIVNGIRLPYTVSCDFRFVALYPFIASLMIAYCIEKTKNDKIKNVSLYFIFYILYYVLLITNITILIN